MAQQHFDTVDEHIGSFPVEVQDILQDIGRRCHAAVPDSGEMISYGIPTITLAGKYVVYFAAGRTMCPSIRCHPAMRTSTIPLPRTSRPKGR